jgi:hypothetical protein
MEQGKGYDPAPGRAVNPVVTVLSERTGLSWAGRLLALRDNKTQPYSVFPNQPEIICLAVMIYVRFPLSLRYVQDLLHERGIDICHETVRFGRNLYCPLFAAEPIRRPPQKP